MSFVKLGKTTLYKNNDATEENKQPHFKGEIEVEYAIPAGAKIGLAGWLNQKGNQKSLFFSVSCHEDELLKEKTMEMDFDELDQHLKNRK